MRGRVVALALTVGLAGCVAPSTQPGWLDRPWIDSGCDAAGWCRIRGELEMPRDLGATRGRLRLDDGACLPVDLTGEFIRAAGDWHGRRVAVRGRAVPLAEVPQATELEGCPADHVLYADRLSLKVAR